MLAEIQSREAERERETARTRFGMGEDRIESTTEPECKAERARVTLARTSF